MALKNQLERSIMHVSQILADAENKIGRERSVLSQIDKELDEVLDSDVARANYGINVFWNSSTTKTGSQLSSRCHNDRRVIKNLEFCFNLNGTSIDTQYVTFGGYLLAIFTHKNCVPQMCYSSYLYLQTKRRFLSIA